MNIFEPELHGIGQVTEQYKQSVDNMVFGEVCDPSKVIQEVIRRADHARQENAEQDREGQAESFQALLVFTSGKITLVNEAKRAIASSASLPLAVIFVVLDTNNFKAMQEF